ncbi:DUF4097 family beta strand repeat-containing protein [Psychrobacillus sp. FJAT-51614]|uniref:DUF4097 family beta strand repeat-containing protein n=1 Tax=Psychrobacillus mangrovi TaxID=3117745 RepID=A0ABU8EZH9_9BACI
MDLKKIAIISLFILLAGAAINIGLNIKDTLVHKTEEILVNDHSYNNIEIVSDNASVEILPSKNEDTKVVFSGKSKKKTKYNFSADVTGDTLEIELKEKRWNFIQFGLSSMNIKLTVYVSEKEYNELKTELDNGRIIAENTHFKNAYLTTDNGSIQLKNIQAENVNVESDNGQIIMEEVEGKINAETNNGRIIFLSTNLERPIQLESDNGAIEIQTNKEPQNATIDVNVDNGKIDIFGSSSKQSVFGNGDNLIKLETNNGKITVKNTK